MTLLATYAGATGMFVIKPKRTQDMAVTAAVTVTISRLSSVFLSISQIPKRSESGSAFY